MHDQKGVVYRIGCEKCDAVYIGETGRMLKDRINQHKSDVHDKKATNGLFQHTKLFKQHKIKWNEVCVIEKEIHWQSRRLKEALFINAIDPSGKNNKKLMNLEKGWDMNPIWHAFNACIRKEVEKK